MNHKVMSYYKLSSLATALLSLTTSGLAQDSTGSDGILVNPLTRFSENYTLPPVDFPVLQRDFEIAPDCGEESYVGHGRLRGRKALITGGDSGIGRAVAIAYAREGADVVINYLPEEQPDADDVVSVINSTTGAQIFTIPGDLRNRTFCIDLANRAHDLLGGLDILVNNAGFSNISFDITALEEHSFQRTIQTNIMAPFWLTQAAKSLLPAGSSIIFTSSGIGEQPAAELIDYAATRAFITNFMRGLARQLTPQGIRVNAVAPALTLTPFLPMQGLNTSAMEYIIEASPMGRIEMPVELSPLYVNLAENAASFVSGGLWTAAGGQG